MDYKKHYDGLMEKAKKRTLPSDVYCERHHIVPKCLGGDNSKTNIVKLLPKEHYIAHMLLFNMYPNNNHLAYAFWMMSNGNKPTERMYRVGGKVYEEIRNKFVEIIINREPTFKGKSHSEESKQKISNTKKGKPGTWIGKTHSEESKIKMSQSAKGRKLSIETKQKMSEFHTGKNKSEETKQKMRDNAKGIGNNYLLYLKKTGLPHARSKTILQFSLDGSFIKEWINAGEAARELNLSYKLISACANGDSKTSQGFMWKYKIK